MDKKGKESAIGPYLYGVRRKPFNIARLQLEGLIHKVFAAETLDLSIPDRFCKSVKPQGMVPCAAVGD